MPRRWSAIVILAASVFIIAALGFHDTRTPSAVTWEPVKVQGLDLERAPGLVLQHEKDGVLWASDGYAIYRSEATSGFLKIHEVRPPLGLATAAYSRRFRELFGFQEAIEVFPVRDDLLLVFVGGEIHRIELASGRTDVVHKLRYFRAQRGPRRHAVRHDRR